MISQMSDLKYLLCKVDKAWSEQGYSEDFALSNYFRTSRTTNQIHIFTNIYTLDDTEYRCHLAIQGYFDKDDTYAVTDKGVLLCIKKDGSIIVSPEENNKNR